MIRVILSFVFSAAALNVIFGSSFSAHALSTHRPPPLRRNEGDGAPDGREPHHRHVHETELLQVDASSRRTVRSNAREEATAAAVRKQRYALRDTFLPGRTAVSSPEAGSGDGGSSSHHPQVALVAKKKVSKWGRKKAVLAERARAKALKKSSARDPEKLEGPKVRGELKRTFDKDGNMVISFEHGPEHDEEPIATSTPPPTATEPPPEKAEKPEKKEEEPKKEEKEECPKETGGTCGYFHYPVHGCSSWRKATCNDESKCVCAPNECAVEGKCVDPNAPEEKKKSGGKRASKSSNEPEWSFENSGEVADNPCHTKEDARVSGSWGFLGLGWLFVKAAPDDTPCVFGADPRDGGKHCIEDDGDIYGSFGWCYTAKDKSQWGSCGEACPAAGHMGILHKNVLNIANAVKSANKALGPTAPATTAAPKAAHLDPTVSETAPPGGTSAPGGTAAAKTAAPALIERQRVVWGSR